MPRSDYAFFHPFRVRYSEVDRQGIAYQAHYLTWFDVAIWEFFRTLPWDFQAQLRDTNTDFHTVRNVIDYHASVEFDQEIEVGVAIGRLGRSSITLKAAIFAKGGDSELASGEVVWVNADQSSHTSAPIPEALADKLKG